MISGKHLCCWIVRVNHALDVRTEDHVRHMKKLLAGVMVKRKHEVRVRCEQAAASHVSVLPDDNIHLREKVTQPTEKGEHMVPSTFHCSQSSSLYNPFLLVSVSVPILRVSPSPFFKPGETLR